MIGNVAQSTYAARVADTGFRLGIDFGTSNTVAVLRGRRPREAAAVRRFAAAALRRLRRRRRHGVLAVGGDAVRGGRARAGTASSPTRSAASTTAPSRSASATSPSSHLFAAVLWAVSRRGAAGRRRGRARRGRPDPPGGRGRPAPRRCCRPPRPPGCRPPVVPNRSPPPHSCRHRRPPSPRRQRRRVRLRRRHLRRQRGAPHAPAASTSLAGDGLADAGGLDVDAAIVHTSAATSPAGRATQWRRLTNPESRGRRRAAWQLWEDARLAKEMLSRAATTYVHVPLSTTTCRSGASSWSSSPSRSWTGPSRTQSR